MQNGILTLEHLELLSANLNGVLSDLRDVINGQIFIGTHQEYEDAYARREIAIGTLVLITDD